MDRLQAMQVFARVVELGSFARAAEALELSRARTSEAVQALEAVLKTRLLHRTTRRIALTDDGRAYYQRVTRLLSDLVEAEAEISRARGSAHGQLRVAMPIALTRRFVLPKLPKLVHRHPELELEIRLENRSVDLAREALDCAISYGTPVDSDLVARPLATTHLLTCASPAYLERHPAPRAPTELVSHNCIAFLSVQTARPTPWEFSRGGSSLVHRPTGNLAFNSMESCVDAALLGLGVTQVLSSVALAEVRDGALLPLLVDFTSKGPALYLIYPPNRHASARLRAFAEFVVEIFREFDSSWQEIVQIAAAKRLESGTRRTEQPHGSRTTAKRHLEQQPRASEEGETEAKESRSRVRRRAGLPRNSR